MKEFEKLLETAEELCDDGSGPDLTGYTAGVCPGDIAEKKPSGFSEEVTSEGGSAGLIPVEVNKSPNSCKKEQNLHLQHLVLRNHQQHQYLVKTRSINKSTVGSN